MNWCELILCDLISMNEFVWINFVWINFYEWIFMNEFSWMNLYEWICMNEFLWMNLYEWICMNEQNSFNLLPLLPMQNRWTEKLSQTKSETCPINLLRQVHCNFGTNTKKLTQFIVLTLNFCSFKCTSFFILRF